jgi:fumarylacetoacetate (FAA) hydrolase family protein
MAANSRAQIQGAMSGNDVNLRDFEDCSADLLGKAKDNNGSCTIGPLSTPFDESFSLGDVRGATVTLDVCGEDGSDLHGERAMNQISRDPLDLVEQTMGAMHQYPDGAMLFLEALFTPSKVRDSLGTGFTHEQGDVSTLKSPLIVHS